MLKNLLYSLLLLTSFVADAQDVVYGVSGSGGSEGGGSIWKVNEDGSEFEVLESYSSNSVSVIPVNYLYTQPLISEDSTKLLYFTVQDGKTQLRESNLSDSSEQIIKEYTSLRRTAQVKVAVKDIIVITESDSLFLLNTTTNSYIFLRKLPSREIFAWHQKYPVRYVNEELIIIDGNSFYKYTLDGQFLGRFASYEDDVEELDNHFVVDDKHIYALTVSAKRLIRISLSNPNEITGINTSTFPNNGNGTYLQNGEKYLAFCNAFGDDIWLYDKVKEEIKALDINRGMQFINVSQLLSFVGNRLYFARGENSGTGFITFTDDSQNITISEYNFDRYVLLNIGEAFLSYSRKNGLFIENTRSEIEIVRRFSFEYPIHCPNKILSSNSTHLLFRREAGGKFGKGDFALWDIEEKRSESFLVVSDTIYVKKIFQVSDTLFKVLEQQPFEVATVRDSVLNKEAKKFNTFGRSDFRILEAKSEVFYISSTDSIYVEEEESLKFLFESKNAYRYKRLFTANDKLYLPKGWSIISEDSISFEIVQLSSKGVESLKYNFARRDHNIITRDLPSLGSQFVVNDTNLIITTLHRDNKGQYASLIKFGLNSNVASFIKIEETDFRIDGVIGSTFFLTHQTRSYGDTNDTTIVRRFDVISLQQKTILNELISIIGYISSVVQIKTSATLQLKSPDKSVDFTKPVSFDNRLDKNEQLSFYLKNEGVGRSLNISKNQLHISGRDSTSFSLSLPENLTLKPNDSVKVQLDFVPTSRGVKEAKLIFNPNVKNARTTSATANNSLEVALIGTAKDKQTISLDLLNEVFMGTTQVITLPEIASSGLPITYSISNNNVALVDNYVLNINDGGEVTITAKQNGNSDFWSADSVTHTLNVLLLLSVEPVSENKAYPNPATSWIKIPFESNGFRQNTIKVADLSGRIFKLKVTVEKSELKVDISPLTAGKYFIKLSNGSYVFVKQ
jgi:hypothetical protein